MKKQQESIEDALKILPKIVTEILQEQAKFPYSFLPNTIVDTLCKATNQNKAQLGLELLPLATAFAEAPVSNFFVGAVAFDSAGNAYLGANFEFANTHIGQTIHAEQSAITYAWACGAKDLALLVINYAPCGHCRQFINEVNLSDDFCILLPETAPQPLSSYLPNAFGPADLDMEARILGSSIVTANDVETLAKHAYKNAHAPYSGSKSAVAVQFDSGDLVAGYYAENAAFNPSLPPLQMALNVRRLQGKNWRTIEKVVLLETPTTLSQKSNSELLLKSIAPHATLDYRSVKAAI